MNSSTEPPITPTQESQHNESMKDKVSKSFSGLSDALSGYFGGGRRSRKPRYASRRRGKSRSRRRVKSRSRRRGKSRARRGGQSTCRH